MGGGNDGVFSEEEEEEDAEHGADSAEERSKVGSLVYCSFAAFCYNALLPCRIQGPRNLGMFGTTIKIARVRLFVAFYVERIGSSVSGIKRKRNQTRPK